ncbi:MAG: transporter substrate-binding domain-containing protein [Synergistaceae bacterium]|nr:transporter substrate-binding domain-containing protein [Synergistaceae bacterium]
MTSDEVRGIEALLSGKEFFTYGVRPSTEVFYNEDDEIEGYSALFCDWLSSLFGVPFKPKIYWWSDLVAGMESGKIDFSGELVASQEHGEKYFMTDAVTERQIKVVYPAGGASWVDIVRRYPLRLAFLEGASVYGLVAPLIEQSFNPVFVKNYDMVYKMLQSGEIDAFFEDEAAAPTFDVYGDITTEDFFPFTYSPLSLATRNPELKPIIGAVRKALQSGAAYHLSALHDQGRQDYLRHKLSLQLTREERDYIRRRVESECAISVAVEFDHYPTSFYNDQENQWQGIALDVLNEISKLTGLSFVRANDAPVAWSKLVDMLERGDAAMIARLIRFKEREGRFLWADTPYQIDRYALLSKIEFEDMKPEEIFRARVGLIKGTAYSGIFREMFPNHANTAEFPDIDAAFAALARGEVDLVMETRNLLLSVTNYREQPGYKVNLLLRRSFGATFGFNLDESTLRSIVSKAMRLVDLAGISDRWGRKTFDYRDKLVQARIPWLIGAFFMLICALALLFVLFSRRRQEKRRLEVIVRNRTRELEVQTRAAQAASMSKGEFLARTSHEIRTPINAIIGMSELALRATDAPSIKRYVMDIRKAGHNLLSIINDILDFSKIESGNLEINPGHYTLSSLLNDVINVMRVRILEKSIVFIVNVDVNIPNNLIGDEARIRQVMLNLLSNAVKYTSEGYVMLSVNSLHIGGDDILLIFEIADSGIGIKNEDLDGLFGKFVRLDGERNRGIEGTGLGLAIAKSLCNAMDGDITVESVYGAGSTFNVTLAQKFVGQDPLAAVKEPEKKRILFFDERELYAQSVLSTLQNLSVPVVVATDIPDFLTKFESGKFEFAFASPALVRAVPALVEQKEWRVKLVLLANLGETSFLPGIRVIIMPAYAVSVANTLNGLSVEERYEEDAIVRFTAPEARILVVDDNQTNLKVAQGLLLPYRVQVDVCERGEDAIALGKAHRYDMIFMDHMMPGMDGIEATARLRGMEQCDGVPIVALTANAVSGMREMFLENGMNDFLSKPIDPSKLESILYKWIPQNKRALFEEKPRSASPDWPCDWPRIEGVDFEMALARLGGDKEAYLEVVRSYVTHTPAILEKLRTPEKDALREYAIAVHGIKGSSYAICAATVGKLAEELEASAKAGDLDTVLAKNDLFLSAAENLIESLASMLENEPDEEKPQKTAPDETLLRMVFEANKNYDVASMEKVMSELERYTYQTRSELVTWLHDQLENLEYDAIQERLERELSI